MSKEQREPIQMMVGYGQITATWLDDVAIWVTDYHANPNPRHESLQWERRKIDVARRFARYKLIEPTIELVEGDEELLDPFIRSEPTAAGTILRVTTMMIPHVDPNEIRPIRELRIPVPDPGTVAHQKIVRDLRAGGSAIFDSYASAMVPRRQPEDEVE